MGVGREGAGWSMPTEILLTKKFPRNIKKTKQLFDYPARDTAENLIIKKQNLLKKTKLKSSRYAYDHLYSLSFIYLCRYKSAK